MSFETGRHENLPFVGSSFLASREGNSGGTQVSGIASPSHWAPRSWMKGRIAAWLVVLAAASHGSAAGAGWRAVMPIFGGPVNAVVVDAGGIVYATADSGIFKSADGGNTWVSATGDLPVLSVQAIAADPVNSGTLFVGTAQAMYKTVNGGSHWSTLTIPNGTSISQIAVARSNPSYVYASTNGSYVYRSTDGGTTWVQSSSGLSGGSSGPSVTTVMAVDPTNPLRVYTGTWRGQLFRSDNGGSSWSVIGGGGTYWVFQLAIAPSAPNVLWATNDAAYTSYGNVLKSTDSGASWSNAGQPAGSEEGSSIAVDRSNPDVAYVATSQGLYKTTGGGTWSRVFAPAAGPAGLSSVVINPANISQLFVGSTFFGPYVSSDGGLSWQQGVSGFAAASITGIDLCAASPSTVYAAAQTVGLLKSGDGGSTWTAVGGSYGFQNQPQNQGGVAVDPANPNHVLLSSGSNIWQSTTGGVSFTTVSSYTPRWIRFNPLTPANVTASIGDWQGGFLFSNTGGASWTIPQSIYIYPGQYGFHPTYSNVVFAAAEQYTGAAHDTPYIMWSNTGGNGGWQQSAAVGSGSLPELALDQSDPTVLYVVGTLFSENTQGVYKFNVSYGGTSVSGVSRIAGTFNNGLGGAVPRRIVYNAATSSLYLTTDHGLFRSTDRAATWVPINTGLTYVSTDALAVTPDGAHVIVGTNGGIWEYDSSVPLAITTSSPLPGGQVNVSYAQTLAASGGTPPYTNWLITGGTQPPGLTLSSGGVLSGTPTTSGTYNFTVRVTDSASATASASFQLTINPPGLAITTTSPLPGGQVNVAYSQILAASGGTQPYTNWLIIGGRNRRA